MNQVTSFVKGVEQMDNTSGVIETTDLKSPGTLFVPSLGQSNASLMSSVYQPYQPGSTTNDTSGAIVLDRVLTDLTEANIVTSDTQETNFAVGGSTVNGNDYYEDSRVWWYPEQNQPGDALKQAEQGLSDWLSSQGAESTDEIAIIWSQGEAEVNHVSDGDPAAREKYKQSTLAVFDRLKDELNYANVKFYVVPTGRLQPEGAANAGLSSEDIASMNNSLAIVREVQAEIATERDDVLLAPGYSDLNMIYEEGQIYGESYDLSYDRWSEDVWHLGHDGQKVNGDRLAQYIALDRGESNVISFTDSLGNPAQSISIARDGLLDINISANPTPGAIQGTILPDVIVGTLAPDEIIGSDGNDVIIASQGVDTLTGGAGSDVFFYDPLVSPNVTPHSDRILDFEVGSDRLDISALLELSDYTGVDPIADKYAIATPLTENSLEIQFDADGAGAQPASTLAILENVDPVEFQDELVNQLIVVPTEF